MKFNSHTDGKLRRKEIKMIHQVIEATLPGIEKYSHEKQPEWPLTLLEPVKEFLLTGFIAGVVALALLLIMFWLYDKFLESHTERSFIERKTTDILILCVSVILLLSDRLFSKVFGNFLPSWICSVCILILTYYFIMGVVTLIKWERKKRKANNL